MDDYVSALWKSDMDDHDIVPTAHRALASTATAI